MKAIILAALVGLVVFIVMTWGLMALWNRHDDRIG